MKRACPLKGVVDAQERSKVRRRRGTPRKTRKRKKKTTGNRRVYNSESLQGEAFEGVNSHETRVRDPIRALHLLTGSVFCQGPVGLECHSP